MSSTSFCTFSRYEDNSSDGGRSLEARVMELERMLDKVGKHLDAFCLVEQITNYQTIQQH